MLKWRISSNLEFSSDYLTKVPEKIGDKKDEKGDWTTNKVFIHSR